VDARRAVSYLAVPESDDYIAIMGVLDASPTDLTAAEVTTELRDSGLELPLTVVMSRLTQLHDWHVVAHQSDLSDVRRFRDLNANNWRYTATSIGRQVQRFYEVYLQGTPVVREIPLQSLNTVVTSLEALVTHVDMEASDLRARAHELFVNHDALDAALVGAEDTLTSLASRFDLDGDRTVELKDLLLGYATRIAYELDKGADRADRALRVLRPRFTDLAVSTVSESDAQELIQRGALIASRGGRVQDWEGLTVWFDPHKGRAARFSMRIVRAIPTFHANLRRLHATGAAGTSRGRALMLAKACLNPDLGTQLFLAAVGDHPWRKLYAQADDDELPRVPPWRDGPQVSLPPALRNTGASGARGRAPAPLDDSATHAEVQRRRQAAAVAHDAALREVLAAPPGATLSDRAARVALVALMEAARTRPVGERRTAAKAGLACTLFHTATGTGLIAAPTWRAWIPNRHVVFHHPRLKASRPDDAGGDPGGMVLVRTEGVA